MNHRLEHTIETRPGAFLELTRSKLHENEKRSHKDRFTHIRFVCEICRQEKTVSMEVSERAAGEFDRHMGCKPRDEWSESPAPTPRMSPAKQVADRERVRNQREE